MSDDHSTRADPRARKVLKAGRLATFNGWALAIFGAGSLLFAFTSLTALVVGGALLVLAWVEFRGRAGLRRLEPEGLRLLGWNQVALFAVLALYCLWSIRTLRVRPPDELETVAALAGLPADSLVALVVVTYVAVIAVSLVVLGLSAWYYWSRARLLREHLAETRETGGRGPGLLAPERSGGEREDEGE